MEGTIPEGRSADGGPERVPITQMTSDLFSLLGIEPLSGRSFTPNEQLPGNDTAVVLSHGFWQTKFGGDMNIIGLPALGGKWVKWTSNQGQIAGHPTLTKI